MTPYEGDLEGVLKSPLSFKCGSGATSCLATVTYSSKVTHLAPPPYDTNCRDYHKDGYSSKENCFSLCLTNFTARHGMIIESIVIPEEKYGNSTLQFAPSVLRNMKYNGDELNPDHLRYLRKDHQERLRDEHAKMTKET
jgi:hypothetical protein